MKNKFDEIVAKTPNLWKRKLLLRIRPGWYVESDPRSDGEVQGGIVKKIIRDKYGIPVCLQVEDGEAASGKKKYDYISVDSVVFYEQSEDDWGDYEDPFDYMSSEEIDAKFSEMGYTEYDEEKCCWRNPKTGKEITY